MPTVLDAARSLTSEDMAFVQSFVMEHTANQINASQVYLVESRLAPLAVKYHLDGVAELVDTLRDPPPQVVADVVDAVISNDTQFLLTDHELTGGIEAALARSVAALEAERPLIIWSAACSSGQEPFSLALLVAENQPELVAANRVRVLATDISPTMIKRCSAAQYSTFEVKRGIPPEALQKYFEKYDRDWKAGAILRGLVKVKVLNLMGSWPGIPKCDVVVLRDVLRFFSPRVAADVLAKVRRMVLRPSGTLVVGAEDTQLAIDAGFVAVAPGVGTCLRIKSGSD